MMMMKVDLYVCFSFVRILKDGWLFYFELFLKIDGWWYCLSIFWYFFVIFDYDFRGKLEVKIYYGVVEIFWRCFCEIVMVKCLLEGCIGDGVGNLIMVSGGVVLKL